jgi:predicted alpha-1,2-mannosidase
MKTVWNLIAGAQLLAASLAFGAEKTPADYVDPWIESTKSRYFFFNTACRPFGMVNLSPDTSPGTKPLSGRWQSGYRYQDKHVYGMAHVHGWHTAGLLVMPTTGVDPCDGMEAWKSEFSHDDEIVQAGYHKLHLDRYDVDVELTSTARVGFHRYTFNQAGQTDLLVWLGGVLGGQRMLDARIERVTDREICGSFVQSSRGGRAKSPQPNEARLFFVIQLDRAPSEWKTWQGNKAMGPLTEPIRGNDLGTFARFNVKAGDQLLVKAGISWCNLKEARNNLETELNHWDFDRVRSESRDEWNQWLSKIEVKGGTEAQKIKFYTDLWHTLLGRRQTHDVSGTYPNRMGPKRIVGQLPLDENGQPKFWYMSFDAIWIMRWNLNALWGLGWPELMDHFANTALVAYKDCGHLPRSMTTGERRGIMTGCHLTDLMVSAYQKGIRGFDEQLALEAMVKGHSPGSTMDRGYNDMALSLRLGYVPMHESPKAFGAAGRTMEHAMLDWSLAQYAKALGHDELYDSCMKRSGNWRNLFDKETGFIRPRMQDGSWKTPFDPMLDANYKGFVEANSWQTTWMATHDVQGLADLMGGNDAYCDKLNEAFEQSRAFNFAGAYGKGSVSYGNQPACGMAHLFNYAGKPWLSQYWVRQVNEHTYGGITPDSGYGGHDEDQGQMGGVSALMSIGLFQARGGCDVDPIYEITAPVFDEVTIHLDSNYYSGKTFQIVTKNNSPENVYIQSATLNGQRLDNCWFYHRDFAKGGTLELVLGPKPNKAWGVNELPPSLTSETPQYAMAFAQTPVPVKTDAKKAQGKVTARGSFVRNEQTPDKAFDGDLTTKWLDFSPKGSWIQRAYDKAMVVSAYAITAAEDSPERDPKDWQLLGSNDGKNWTTLDKRTGEQWSGRHQQRVFSTSNQKAYRFYRLNIAAVRDVKNANSVQIAEIEFK